MKVIFKQVLIPVY